MNAATRLPWGALWAWPLLATAVGCADFPIRNPAAEDITARREQRTAEAVSEFEAQRGFAEFQAALTQWNCGDVKQCEKVLRQLLQRNPDHRDARLLLSEMCLCNNRPQEAFEQMETALRAHPDDARVQYAMGLLLDATGQSGGALTHYQRAASLEPGNEIYTVSYEAARQAAAGTKLPQAAEDTAPGRFSSPANAAGAIGGPASPAVRSASHAQAIDRAGGADSADASTADPAATLLRRAREALADNSPESAGAYFREAASLKPDDPQILISAAVEALRANQPDLAIDLLQPDEKRFSGSAQAHRILGVAHYRLGDYEASQVALQQALSLDKSSALAYFLMECTSAKLGQPESAEAHYRQARVLDPRYTAGH